MKKSSFAALLLGVVSGVLFALGLCMALIEDWQSRGEGIVLGCAGLALGALTIWLWRRMEHRPPLALSKRAAARLAVRILGTLAFGGGMCLCLVWERLAAGIAVGLAGILLLLCEIPLVKGLR